MVVSKQLFVRNIPYRATDEDLVKAFGGFGVVRRGFVVRDNVTKQSRGFGYVTFSSPEDASAAKSAPIEIFGREVHCKFSETKPDGKDHIKKGQVKAESDEEIEEVKPRSIFADIEGMISADSPSVIRRCLVVKLESPSLYDALKLGVLSKLVTSKLVCKLQPPSMVEKSSNAKAHVFLECPTRAAAVDCYEQLKEFREQDSIKFTFTFMEKKPSDVSEEPQEEDVVKDEPEIQMDTSEMKKYRVIVRNLPFKLQEKEIHKYFSKYGKAIDVNYPLKADGQPKGFAFIQYGNEEDAKKAVSEGNMTKINGRVIAVDWAIPKSDYEKTIELKSEAETAKLDQTKQEAVEMAEEPDKVKKKKEKKKLATSHDIGEGKTVFVRGLQFETDEGTFSAFMEQHFGPVFYAKICIDDIGRSKGTGFVKFINKEHADECIRMSSETPMFLDGRRLTITPALDPKSAEKAKNEKASQKEENDPRNLRLSAVGYIKQGTPEAEGMLPADLEHRRQLYSANCAKLRNPVMFVSDTRLSIHNIPTSVDDKQLKELIIKKMDDKTVRVTECRIMRDLNRPNAAGVGKSRGYGFVAFRDPKHALSCLEKLNNNPEIFGDKKCLIVQFSIENRSALEKRKRRLEKSKEHLKVVDTNSKEKKGKNDKKSKQNKKKVLKKKETKASN